MDIEKVLRDVGLPDREVKIYLSLLELGESTVLPISKKSGIKRTYCYDILASLQEKRMVTFVERNGRRRYAAEDPASIEQVLKARLEHFTQALPELRSIYGQAGGKPKVRFYEGGEAVLALLDELGRVRSFEAITSPDHAIKLMGAKADLLGQAIAKRKIKVRELYTRGGLTIVWIKYYQKPLQEYRFLPTGLQMPTDIILFENKMALISYAPDVHALVVEGSQIVQAHKHLFELLWQATPALG